MRSLLTNPDLSHLSPPRGREDAPRERAITTVVLATLLSTVGCGGASPSDQSTRGAPRSDPADAGTNPPDKDAPDASSSGPSPAQEPTVSISGVTNTASGAALPDVKVCLHVGIGFATRSVGVARAVLPDPVACAVSAANGSFRVPGAPAGHNLALTFHKEGFAPMLRPMVVQTDDITLPADESALVPTPLVFMGTPADPSKGQISFFVSTPGAGPRAEASVKATAFDVLSGLNGPSEEPRYLDGDGDGVPAAGARAGAAGGFVNVRSALYFLQFEGTSATCAPSAGLYGYPGGDSRDRKAVLIVPVIEGYVTGPVGVSCTNAL